MSSYFYFFKSILEKKNQESLFRSTALHNKNFKINLSLSLSLADNHGFLYFLEDSLNKALFGEQLHIHEYWELKVIFINSVIFLTAKLKIHVTKPHFKTTGKK